MLLLLIFNIVGLVVSRVVLSYFFNRYVLPILIIVLLILTFGFVVLPILIFMFSRNWKIAYLVRMVISEVSNLMLIC